MADLAPRQLRGPGGRSLRVAHLTTVDMSLALLLPVELDVDLAAGLDVVGISAPGLYVDRVERLGVAHVPVVNLTRAWQPGQDLRATLELARLLRRLRLDVLHTHNPKTGVLGRVLGRLVGVPVVVNTCHGLWAGSDDRALKRALVYGAEAFASLFSDAELFQNAADLATLRRWTRPGRAVVVGNGTDLARFVPDDAQRKEVRRALGVGDEEVLVGGVGRLVAEKGIAEFAETASRLGFRARFVWAGPEDPDKADALSGVDASVTWLGEWRDMPGLYNALDVFVLPSYREGFSRSAMEAAACETAMVLSDIRGCREIGSDRVHLRLVPPRDATALTRAVDQLIEDADERRRLGTAAGVRARAEFDQRQIAMRSLETYAAVARRKRLGWSGEEVSGAPAGG